jgi:hypothetical protein
MWKIHVPPRIHVFLWLVANNKILTRDNLAKRRVMDDRSCVFCSESETVLHLLYECCVARTLWGIVFEIVGLPVVSDFESMAKWWTRSKKYNSVNVFCIAVIWALWNLRNKLCFPGQCWERNEKGGGKLCQAVKKLDLGEQLRRCDAIGDVGARWRQEVQDWRD